MPFESQAQRAFMFARHPEIARRWASEYPNQGPLPQHVQKSPAASKVAGVLAARRGY
jgi:hypothetical protein